MGIEEPRRREIIEPVGPVPEYEPTPAEEPAAPAPIQEPVPVPA